MKTALLSSQSRVWATESSWAWRMRAAGFGSASAPSVDTLFTGEKVRSNPETAFGGADTFAMNPYSSLRVSGSRPCLARNSSSDLAAQPGSEVPSV